MQRSTNSHGTRSGPSGMSTYHVDGLFKQFFCLLFVFFFPFDDSKRVQPTPTSPSCPTQSPSKLSSFHQLPPLLMGSPLAGCVRAAVKDHFKSGVL